MHPAFSQVWVNLLGLVAGIASWKSGWEATALPSTASAGDIPLPAAETTETKLAPYLDDPLKGVITAPTLDEM